MNKLVESARQKKLWELRTSYILGTTGPQILDECIQEYRDNDLIVYPQHYFYPARVMEKSRNQRRKLAEKNNSYAVHHYTGSWISPVMHIVMWFGYFLRM